jgi:predicted SprT family Zn-dependent metalloprotease
MIAFWSFKPKTQLENKAFKAAKVYLESKKENVNKYYLAENGLDVNTGLYHFYIKHTSTYRKGKTVADESYKNGVIYYDTLNGKVVEFKLR